MKSTALKSWLKGLGATAIVTVIGYAIASFLQWRLIDPRISLRVIILVFTIYNVGFVFSRMRKGNDNSKQKGDEHA